MHSRLSSMAPSRGRLNVARPCLPVSNFSLTRRRRWLVRSSLSSSSSSPDLYPCFGSVDLAYPPGSAFISPPGMGSDNPPKRFHTMVPSSCHCTRSASLSPLSGNIGADAAHDWRWGRHRLGCRLGPLQCLNQRQRQYHSSTRNLAPRGSSAAVSSASDNYYDDYDEDGTIEAGGSNNPSGDKQPELQTHFFDYDNIDIGIERRRHQQIDLDEDIEKFASSCFSQILPNANNGPNRMKPQNIGLQRAQAIPLSSSLDVGLRQDHTWDLPPASEQMSNYDMENDNKPHLDGLDGDESQFAYASTLTLKLPTENIWSRKVDLDDSRSIHRTAMQILKNFDPENPPPDDDLAAVQMWLECTAQRESVLKYQKMIENARDHKIYDTMSAMQKYVVQWYQPMLEAIDMRQKSFITNIDAKNKKARKRYGPFLCSTQPEKLAVVTAHEALMHILLHGTQHGREGVTLVSMVTAIGDAVQMEVLIQKWLKQKFKEKKTITKNSEKSSENDVDIVNDYDDDDDNDDDSDDSEDDDVSDDQSDSTSSDDDRLFAIDSWAFTAAHLKQFIEEQKRVNPNFTKSKRSIDMTLRLVKKTFAKSENWTVSDKAHLGAALLSILIESAKIFKDGKEDPAFRIEKRFIPRTRKLQSFVVLDDRLFKTFVEEDIVSFAASTTRHTPMIIPPKDWTDPNRGGYRWLKVDLMRFHGSNKQREALKRADLTKVYDGLNKLGRTAWRINKNILKAGEYCWDNNIAIGDIPSRTDFVLPCEPERPSKIDPALFADVDSLERKKALEDRRAYREALFKRRKIHQKNMDLRSLRCSAVLKLNQAAKFKDFDELFFPYNLDFRGRAYPIPPHLSNIGSDLCRGMLTFAEAKPLGKRGLYWLKVHLANVAGKNKMSFDDRVRFVDENMDNIRASVTNTFGENAWWMTLEDPFQGLATCHEIINAIDSGNPELYMCSLPVHMDGSCNGLQHYAALGRDIGGGKAVNLLEGDGPQDVYVGVMHEVIRRVAEEAERQLDFDTSNEASLTQSQKAELKRNRAAKLVNGYIDRGVVKRTVMTSVYGVTMVGARQQILEKIEEKLEDKGYDIDEIDREIFAASGYLASLTMDVMGDLFQGAKKTQNWLTHCARLISQQEHPVSWISPIGVPCIQPYTTKQSSTIVTVMQSVTVVDTSDDLPIHKSRQVTAFPPNYIHSLDSSHMLLTALEMDRRDLAFSAVHDSFWTHACDVDEMNAALRDCFVDLYSRPLLEELKESWELRYPEINFPDIPAPGKLDLNEVKSATYFFQ